MKYTDEERQFIIEQYTKSEDTSSIIEELASKFSTTTRSIVAILARAKVYQKQGYKPKYGDQVYSKEELVQLIEVACHTNASAFEGLEKAPKHVLFKILEILKSK